MDFRDKYGEFITSDEDKILLTTIREYIDKEVKTTVYPDLIARH